MISRTAPICLMLLAGPIYGQTDARDLLLKSDEAIFAANSFRLAGRSSTEGHRTGGPPLPAGASGFIAFSTSFSLVFAAPSRYRYEYETQALKQKGVIASDGVKTWVGNTAFPMVPMQAVTVRVEALEGIAAGRSPDKVLKASLEREEPLDFGGKQVACEVVRAEYKPGFLFGFNLRSLSRTVWIEREHHFVVRDYWEGEMVGPKGEQARISEHYSYSEVEVDPQLADELFEPEGKGQFLARNPGSGDLRSLAKYVPLPGADDKPAVAANPGRKLTMEPTIVAPPEVSPPNTPNLGAPLARLGPQSNGTGGGGGIGSGTGSSGGFGGGAFRVGGGVTQPAVVLKIDPEYTEEARQAKLAGTVLLQLIVGVDGKAHEIKVIRGIGKGLDEKAVEAVAKWKFMPGKKNGQPVPVYATVEVHFRM